MKVDYRKRFLKELSKIPSPIRQEIETFVFDDIPALNNFSQCNKIERMKGYPHHFKVRFGSYRVGIKIEEDALIFERVLHRKEIYRYFP